MVESLSPSAARRVTPLLQSCKMDQKRHLRPKGQALEYEDGTLEGCEQSACNEQSSAHQFSYWM